MSSVRTQRCRDCAFHPKSPENEFGSGGCAGEGASIIQTLERQMREGTATPFFCHENLDCIDNDGWRAVKTLGLAENEALADKLEVCAGWAAAYRRIVGREFNA